MGCFCTWQKRPAGKTPFYITSADESLLAFAGLRYMGKKPDGEALTTFTVITTTRTNSRSGYTIAAVILEADDFAAGWEAEDPRKLLRPRPAEMLQCYPACMRVDTPKNNAPDEIAPARK